MTEHTERAKPFPRLEKVDDPALTATIKAKVTELLKRERDVSVQRLEGQLRVAVLTEEPEEVIDGNVMLRLQRDVAVALNDPGVTLYQINIPAMNAMTCSFCGKPRADVQKLVAGPNVNICDACIDLAHRIVSEEQAAASSATKS